MSRIATGMAGGLQSLAGGTEPSTLYGPNTPANHLLTGLVGYWQLNEASGSRLDSSGNGSTLLQTGSVTQAAGILTNAAVFNGSASNFLRCADNAFLSMGTGVTFTMTLWYFPTAGPSGSAFAQCAGKTTAADTLAHIEYCLGDGAGVTQSLVCDGASNSNLSKTGTISLNTWHFLVMQIRGVTPTHAINIDQGVEVTQVGNWAQDSTNGFTVGGFPSTSRMINGRVCEVGLWKAVLNSTQLNQLYNSGAGLAFSSFN